MGAIVTLVTALHLVGTGFVGASSTECSTDSLDACYKPLRQYMLVGDGAQMLSAIMPGAGSISLATISDDQWVHACIVFTDLAPCLVDVLAHCSTKLGDVWDELMVDAKPALHRTASLRKLCNYPEFGSKARKFLTCNSRLTTESPIYSTCNSESMPMLRKAVVHLGTAFRMPPKERTRPKRTVAQIACCASKRRHACLLGEVERVCGREAAVIFEEVHVASTDALSCDAYMDSCEETVNEDTPLTDSWAKDL